ncbi:hypothetical protein FJ973_29835 [Mesorhizobium sp. B2-1-3]|uniref:hypothetical protein n=1 Tax=Mesorhizobium sp. B2-1-3 TaxID=2589972 RepID=UPI00112B191F|nr:hypothetical protein [Mesorhizobium sp. B2-1-3]TPN03845.1 hypothetical protein FJ973_29835 [Mesorhizobium sp. B2-1-3]
MTRVGETALLPELEKLQEWLREPDHRGVFGNGEILDWINRRPTHIIPKALAALSPCLDGAEPVTTTTDILREWFGGERYARDHEYLDANFGKQAGQVVDYLALRASLARKPVAWRGVVDGRTAFLCRTRDEIDRLASDYNATIEPIFASPPLPDTEEKRA